jgi:hypothetical protein
MKDADREQMNEFEQKIPLLYRQLYAEHQVLNSTGFLITFSIIIGLAGNAWGTD